MVFRVRNSSAAQNCVVEPVSDMRKVVAVQSLNTEILMDCGNVMLAALNFSFICFQKFKYYGTFIYSTPIIHSDAHLNPLKRILSDKSLIIGDI